MKKDVNKYEKWWKRRNSYENSVQKSNGKCENSWEKCEKRDEKNEHVMKQVMEKKNEKVMNKVKKWWTKRTSYEKKRKRIKSKINIVRHFWYGNMTDSLN